jgi:glycosyltransferase involved in cell wall biosynthesis
MAARRPLVSVCMPAHNAERWIGDAVESVLQQTYSHFELVISENASTDGTAAIARSYRDPRIRLEPTTSLIDPIENHSRSVQLSTGALIKFLHADDKLLPTCLEEMVALATEDPRIGLVFAPREILLDTPENEADIEWEEMYAHLHERFVGLTAVNEGILLFRQMLADGFEDNWFGEPTAVLASRACLARVGLFGLRLFQIADLDLWLRIALTHRIGYIPHPLSVYRHHDQSVTAANARVGRDWLDRLWMLEGLLAQPELEPADRATVERLRNASFARALRSQLRRLIERRAVAGMFQYLSYRSRALAGNASPLYDVLDSTPPDRGGAERRTTVKNTHEMPLHPSISVCITNHNYAKYLPSSIESVLAQTYSAVEVVVVDDGSTDDSRQVLERYADRVRVILQEQAGQAAAGWAAFQAAGGDIVIFLDADDVLESRLCAELAEAFRREPELAMVQWRLGTIDAAGRSLNRVIPPRPGLMPSGDLSGHVLRIRNWHYQVASGAAYATWAARRVLPAQLPEGEYHALDQWLNELMPLLGPVRSLDVIGGSRRVHRDSFSETERPPAEWPRRMIRLMRNSHEHVRVLATELGQDCPEDVRDFRDPAFLGWRLWSLTVDPEEHPFPDDRRSTMAIQGIATSLTHPYFSWRHRVKRAAWFAVIGSLPRSVARRTVSRFQLDGPISFSHDRNGQ